ncbi:methyl-accepting chemotaxis protein [bacterium]|nr:methyl-accepting chemotaxis protein [bacterium]
MSIRQSTINLVAGIAFAIMALLLAGSVYFVGTAVNAERTAVSEQAELKQLGFDIHNASALLTDEVRKYAVTADPTHLRAYWREVEETKTGEKTLARLKELGIPQAEFDLLEQAKRNSDTLIATEIRAMRLMLEATGANEGNMPSAIASRPLAGADHALGHGAKLVKAREILYDAAYETEKARIEGPITEFQRMMNARAAKSSEEARALTQRALGILGLLSVLIPIGMGAVLWIFRSQVGLPIVGYIRALEGGATSLTEVGTEELRKLAGALNHQFKSNLAMQAQQQAMIARLTELAAQVGENAEKLSASSENMASATEQSDLAVQQVSLAIQHVASSAVSTNHSAQSSNISARELAAAVASIAEGAISQAREVQETAATAQQMAQNVEQVSQSAQEVAETSALAKQASERGAQAVRATQTGMGEIQQVVAQAARKITELGQLSDTIGAVVETIDDIAEQTNLLALNAAIEAARAGEHGRGFAVVADEVRKLAERSQRETKAIADLIRQVQSGTQEAVNAMSQGTARVEQGTERADQAAKALAEILSAVERTAAQVGAIASAAREMNTGAHGVVTAMASIKAVVEANTAATEQMSAQAGQVTEAMQTIAAGAETQSASAEEVSASAAEMAAQVKQMAIQAQELSGMSDQLKGIVAGFQAETGAGPAQGTPAERRIGRSEMPLLASASR